MSNIEKDSNRRNEANRQIQKRVEHASRIFEEHRALILATIRYSLTDGANAEDIFQDFFLSLVHKPVSDGEQNVKAYLRQAIKNDITDAARRADSYRARVTRYAEDHDSNTVSKDPLDIVALAEEVGITFRLIKEQVWPREAEAITERFGYDHSTDEAARRMGVDKRTYSRYLWAGLKKMRDSLGTHSER
jgi:RNA polymerase sigma factor (sigma-70 family)